MSQVFLTKGGKTTPDLYDVVEAYLHLHGRSDLLEHMISNGSRQDVVLLHRLLESPETFSLENVLEYRARLKEETYVRVEAAREEEKARYERKLAAERTEIRSEAMREVAQKFYDTVMRLLNKQENG